MVLINHVALARKIRGHRLAGDCRSAAAEVVVYSEFGG